MKKIIIIVGLIAVLGGGGFFAWSFFMKSDDAAEKKPVPEKKVFQELSPFLVNLADPGGKRYLKVTVKLELSDPELGTEITDKMFEIRDGVLMFLSSLEVDDITLPAGKMTLKRELIAKLNRMLTTGKVRNAYFTEFLIQ